MVRFLDTVYIIDNSLSTYRINKNKITLICAKFGADLINRPTAKVTSRKKQSGPVFAPPCKQLRVPFRPT